MKKRSIQHNIIKFPKPVQTVNSSGEELSYRLKSQENFNIGYFVLYFDSSIQ